MKRSLLFFFAALLSALMLSCSPTPPTPSIKQVFVTHKVRMHVGESKGGRTASELKLQSSVLELYTQYLSNGGSFVIPAAVAAGDFNMQPSFAKVDSKDRIYTYIYIKPTDDIYGKVLTTSDKGKLEYTFKLLHDTLLHFGGMMTDHDTSGAYAFLVAQVWVPAKAIDSVAQLSYVAHIALVTEPLLCSMPPIVGSKLTRADIAHEIWPDHGGAGVKLGIISDDCGSKIESGATTSPMTDAYNASLHPLLPSARPWLPAPTTIKTIDDDWSGDRSHEGLAMMEVVADIAPQTNMLFATGFGKLDPNGHQNLGMLTLKHAIDTLVHEQCSVITDDILYTEEPAFEDGPIAHLIEGLTTDSLHPLIYTSAAGNWARDIYSFTFKAKPSQPVGIGSTLFTATIHDLSNGDYLDHFFIKTGKTLEVMLQWDDPYLHPVAANDFDLFLVDVETNRIVEWSTNTQDGDISSHFCMPYEHLTHVPNACDGRKGFKLFIAKRHSGQDNPNPRMKLLILGAKEEGRDSHSRSIFGHAAANGCIACGAINPGNDYNQIEDFSSRGPVEIVETNVAASPETHHRPVNLRMKPDVSSVDGLTTTVRTLEYFRGTSAAAPTVAAMAARLLGAGFSMPISPIFARFSIVTGCIHYGDGPVLFPDTVYGWGRCDLYRSTSMALHYSNGDKYANAYTTADASAAASTSVTAQLHVFQGIPPGITKIYVSATIEGYASGPVTMKLIPPGGPPIPLSPIISGAVRNLNSVIGQTGVPWPAAPLVRAIGYYKMDVPPTLLGTAFPQFSLWQLEVDFGAGTPGVLRDWGVHFE